MNKRFSQEILNIFYFACSLLIFFCLQRLFFLKTQPEVNILTLSKPVIFNCLIMGLRFDAMVLSFLSTPFFVYRVVMELFNHQNKLFLKFLFIGIPYLYFLGTLMLMFFVTILGLPHFLLFHERVFFNEFLWDEFLLKLQIVSIDIIGKNILFILTGLLFFILYWVALVLWIYKKQSLKIENLDLNIKNQKKYNIFIKNILILFLLLAFLARGRLGEHHLRREDSWVSNSNSINELVLTPLWSWTKTRP